MANLDHLSADELTRGVAAGGRLVTFSYAYSFVVASFRGTTRVHFVPVGKSVFWVAAGPTLITLLAGPWGLPWGVLFTLEALVTNFGGGRDVTDEVMGRSAVESSEA